MLRFTLHSAISKTTGFFGNGCYQRKSGLTQQISKPVYLIKFMYVMFCTLLIRLCKMYCKGILVHHWF